MKTRSTPASFPTVTVKWAIRSGTLVLGPTTTTWLRLGHNLAWFLSKSGQFETSRELLLPMSKAERTGPHFVQKARRECPS